MSERPFSSVSLTKQEATDPVERLKNVIASVIAGLHLTCTQAKPFNPILGETYQGVFEDGTLIYCEQVSHHPMVSAWEMIGPNGCFHFSGHGQWIGSFRGNSVKGYAVIISVYVICLPELSKVRVLFALQMVTGSNGARSQRSVHLVLCC